MRCPKCGIIQPVGVKFCMECGARMPAQSDTAPNVVFHPPKRPQPSVHRPSVAPQHPPASSAPGQPLTQPKMKWFKFLIYFGLWIGALIYLSRAGIALTGADYYDAVLLYELFPALRLLDILYGVLLLGCAAFTVYTRYALARFRRNGPTCLFVLYCAGTILTCLYSAAACTIQGYAVTEMGLGQTLLSGAIALLIHVAYFRKRQHLFVN